MFPLSRRLDQLTFTRFLAALSVVFYHGGRKVGFLDYVPMFTLGPVAVSYFFALSGFVMALAYYRPDIKFDFRSYWLARFSRIYPVYLLAFVLACIYYIDIISKIEWGKILANIFLYQAWIPLYSQTFNIAAWSLSVEAFFYIVFPFLIVAVAHQSPKKLIIVSLGYWIFSRTVHSILIVGYLPEMKNWLSYFPLFHLDVFLLGVAGGIWFVTRGSHLMVNQTLNKVLLFTALGFIFLLLSLYVYQVNIPMITMLDGGMLAPLFLVIILTLALDTSRLSHGLSHPWLILLGDASYALYILHIPLGWLYDKFLIGLDITLSYDLKFIIFVVMAVFLCVLVFKYVEHPARDWLRANVRLLPLIVLDITLIVFAIWLSFYLRLGDGVAAFLRTQNFAIRVGVVLFFAFLLVFRYYVTHSLRSLMVTVLVGTIALTGLMYFGWIYGWVEGFPRPIIILIAVFVFLFLFLSRFVISRVRPALLN